jgi:hypothetical protein
MPYTEKQLVNNLRFFVDDCLDSRMRAFQRSIFAKSYSKEYCSLLVLESYLWLHSGVKLGYFPIDTSRRVAYEFMGSILQAHYIAEKSKPVLERFAPSVQSLLDAELSGRVPLFGAGAAELSATVGVQCAFQSILMLSTSFEQAPACRDLGELLIFGNEQDWRAAVTSVADSTAPESAPREDDWFYEGFFGMIDYMKACRLVIGDIDITSDDAVWLKQQFRELQEWRLNFRNKIVYDRFLSMARTIASNLGRDFHLSEEQLRFEVHDLLTDWGALPFESTAGAR